MAKLNTLFDPNRDFSPPEPRTLSPRQKALGALRQTERALLRGDLSLEEAQNTLGRVTATIRDKVKDVALPTG